MREFLRTIRRLVLGDGREVLREAEAIVDAACSWKWDLLREAEARMTHGALQAAVLKYHEEEGDEDWNGLH